MNDGINNLAPLKAELLITAFVLIGLAIGTPNETRICRNCKEEQSIMEYAWYRTGESRVFICRQCSDEGRKKRRQARKKMWGK